MFKSWNYEFLLKTNPAEHVALNFTWMAAKRLIQSNVEAESELHEYVGPIVGSMCIVQSISSSYKEITTLVAIEHRSQ